MKLELDLGLGGNATWSWLLPPGWEHLIRGSGWTAICASAKRYCGKMPVSVEGFSKDKDIVAGVCGGPVIRILARLADPVA